MTAKDYLSQAYRIDRMVNAKLGQIRCLRDLAANTTAAFGDERVSRTRNVHKMEDIIVKIVDLENELSIAVEELVDLKRDIVATIKKVDNAEYQVLLELRYLCFKPWNEIAEDMRYNINSIFKMHRRALDSCKVESGQ